MQNLVEANATLMSWKDTVIDFLIRYGFQLLGAFVILTVGFLLARWLGNSTGRWLAKHNLELPIRTLIVRLVKLTVMALALLLALDKFGVQITPMIAGIGVAGAGVALALQGVLGNLAAGLQIIFSKPFHVGDYVELVGVYGQVTNIELFSTVLLHADESIVRVPNRKIIGEILHNYGTKRQLELTVGVGYGTDLKKMFVVVNGILAANPRVLKQPAPLVGISALAESSITISMKPWVAVLDFGETQLQLYQAIVEKFRAEGIEIPFPQREVRVVNGELRAKS